MDTKCNELYNDLLDMVLIYSVDSLLHKTDSNKNTVPYLVVVAEKISKVNLFVRLFILICLRSPSYNFLKDKVFVFNRLRSDKKKVLSSGTLLDIIADVEFDSRFIDEIDIFIDIFQLIDLDVIRDKIASRLCINKKKALLIDRFLKNMIRDTTNIEYKIEKLKRLKSMIVNHIVDDFTYFRMCDRAS